MHPNGVAFLSAVEPVLAPRVFASHRKSARLRGSGAIAPDAVFGTPGPLHWGHVHNSAHMIGMEWHGTPLHFYENVHEKSAQAKTVVAWLCVGFCHALGAAVVRTAFVSHEQRRHGCHCHAHLLVATDMRAHIKRSRQAAAEPMTD